MLSSCHGNMHSVPVQLKKKKQAQRHVNDQDGGENFPRMELKRARMRERGGTENKSTDVSADLGSGPGSDSDLYAGTHTGPGLLS